MLSGLTSQLHPDVNLWSQMEAYAQQIVGDDRLKGFAPQLLLAELRSLLNVPAQLRRLIQLAETGKLQVRTLEDPATARRMDRLERRVGRLNGTIIASATLLAGVLLYTNGSLLLGLAFWGMAAVVWIVAALDG
jgi:predicted unusual protein kinase regulating ubiquinone biosynthesis (AarF/ABC1/UbiB family)